MRVESKAGSFDERRWGDKMEASTVASEAVGKRLQQPPPPATEQVQECGGGEVASIPGH